MKLRFLYAIIAALAIIAAALVSSLAGCFRALPDGMKIVNMYRGVKTIVLSSQPGNPVIVEANVISFKWNGNFVYGYKKSHLYTDGTESKEGYFILDLKTSKVVYGLSEAEMWTRMRKK